MTGTQRKKTWLAVLGVGFLLALGADVVFLIWSMGRHKEAEDRLEQQKRELAGLYGMAPFPSPENVEVESRNLEMLVGAFYRIQERLALRQVEPNLDLKQPTVFMDSFWQTRRDLLNQARAAGVELPKEFGFGFENYLKGTPPHPDHVPRLMQQLTIVRRLCDMLLQAKVTAIDAVGREVFEAEGDGEGPRSPPGAVPSLRPGRRPRGASAVPEEEGFVNRFNSEAGLLKPGDLYATMRFVLLFRGREETVLQVLNALAAHEMFLAIDNLVWQAPVNQVTIRKRLFSPGAGTSVEEVQRGVPESKESRIVSGREAVLTVRLEVDAYRFARRVE